MRTRACGAKLLVFGSSCFWRRPIDALADSLFVGAPHPRDLALFHLAHGHGRHRRDTNRLLFHFHIRGNQRHPLRRRGQRPVAIEEPFVTNEEMTVCSSNVLTRLTEQN